MFYKKVFCEITKIHKKVPVSESYLNTFAELQPAALLRNRPQLRCFPVTTLHTFKFSGTRKFLMNF